MAVARYLHSTGVTISVTEIGLTNGTSTIASNTDDGAYSVVLDLGAVAAGDEFQFAYYEKAHDSDTAVKQILANFKGTVPGSEFVMPPITLGNGFDWSLKKIAGTDRSIGWSVWRWT